jgi:hypothetical protein
MAIVAVHHRVAARQREAGLAVIYPFTGRLPAYEWEISTIVLVMAAHTVIAGRSRRQPHGVHPAALFQSLADLAMAFQALEFFGPGAKVVAFRALQRAG